MAIDLSALSIPELLALQKDLVLEVPRRVAAERQKVVEDLKKLAAERGFDLNDLLGGKVKGASKSVAGAAKAVRGPAAAKYRSKDGKEWSGRGRKPGWVVAHLAAGGKLEDLAI
jgi:DNA-binding protein H-NS